MGLHPLFQLICCISLSQTILFRNSNWFHEKNKFKNSVKMYSSNVLCPNPLPERFVLPIIRQLDYCIYSNIVHSFPPQNRPFQIGMHTIFDGALFSLEAERWTRAKVTLSYH